MEVIRTKFGQWEGLCSLTIDGLRIGAVNHAPIEDPMITFLRNVVSTIPCAAHMSLDPWECDPVEALSTCYPCDRFIPTHVGTYSHLTIFEGEDRPYGAYFPNFTADDLAAKKECGCPLIDNLLRVDQPMLYLGVDDQNEVLMRDMFLNPPSDLGKYGYHWFEKATIIAPVVLAGGHAEGSYHAFARTQDCFNMLIDPLERTQDAIQESEWFKANEDKFQWSDADWEWCLVLPGNKQVDHS